MRIKTTDAHQTYELGRMLGEEIISSDIEEALVIALEGDLGAGKTTFAKGLAKGLGIDANIVSPTFILIGSYTNNKRNLYHIDPYRLQDTSSLVSELNELMKIPYAVIAIEWAQRLKQYLPKHSIHVAFEHEDENKRTITTSFF